MPFKPYRIDLIRIDSETKEESVAGRLDFQELSLLFPGFFVKLKKFIIDTVFNPKFNQKP